MKVITAHDYAAIGLNFPFQACRGCLVGGNTIIGIQTSLHLLSSLL